MPGRSRDPIFHSALSCCRLCHMPLLIRAAALVFCAVPVGPSDLTPPREARRAAAGSREGGAGGDAGRGRQRDPHAQVFPVPPGQHVDLAERGPQGVGGRALPDGRPRRALDRGRNQRHGRLSGANERTEVNSNSQTPNAQMRECHEKSRRPAPDQRHFAARLRAPPRGHRRHHRRRQLASSSR